MHSREASILFFVWNFTRVKRGLIIIGNNKFFFKQMSEASSNEAIINKPYKEILAYAIFHIL